MATRDIAQEIINAVKAGKPDYVVTGLVQERADKIKTENLGGKVPTNDTILATAAALASAGRDALTGGSKEDKSTTTPPAAIRPGTDIYDSAENYDSYTLPLSYDYSGSSASAGSSLSKVIGYAIVGLVLLVVADRLMGK